MTKKEPLHLSKIRSIYAERHSKNSGYSLRSFARDLEVSPATLSNLMSGKKGLSEDSGRRIAKKLSLNRNESKAFILSVVATHGRSYEAKVKATSELEHWNRSTEKTSVLSPQELEEIQNWQHFTILELIELEGCEHSVEWFAKKLGLSMEDTQRTLLQLQKLGLISHDGQVYRATSVEIATENDVPSTAVKAFHSAMMKKAEKVMHSSPVQLREFLGMTVAFDSKDLEEAKESIRDFQEQFARKFYSEAKAKDSVYQLSVQFFRLDQPE